MRPNNGSPALPGARLRAVLAAWLLACAFVATPAHADLQVNLRRDKVELNDGTVVECIVLMQTPRGVLIAVKDPNKEDGVIQKVIPSSKVKSIVRGEDEGQMKGLKTEEELARKVIQGSGYRKEGVEEQPQPINPTGPIEAIQPLVPNKTTDPNGPKPVANSKLTPQQVAQEYLSRFPDLREASQIFMGGSERVGELFQRAQKDDPILREQLDGFLNLFLKSIQPPDKTVGKRAPVKPKAPAPKPPAPKPAPPPAKQEQDKKE
ncbi:MAG: hypothetical protein KIS92_25300 [Planctomycetota bacterium]|nr:hypothetical protein [Planctomycetota bacterium]